MSRLRTIAPGPAEWDAFLAARPEAHILQTSAWGELKSRFGWSAERIALARGEHIVAGALVLFRRLPLQLGALAYIPKGPIVDPGDSELAAALMTGLDRLCRKRRAVLLKIEPDAPYAAPFARLGFRPSPHTIQPRRTILVDLASSEQDMLAAMHPKTRYNIRLAERKGVTVREAARSDLPVFDALMQATGARGGFASHAPAYYQVAFELFVPARARLFVAEVDAQIVAGLFAFAHGERAWYFYGASGDAHRDKMPNHALQWRAMRWARSIGCRAYDLWGIPDEDEATLEAQYLSRGDGLWGVYRFKRGFGGRVACFAGALDRAYNPVIYRLYLLALKRRSSASNL
jgi:lipid II:glycine glycyltransferase (peptidoglycan interpeptide bridge formation enzyme)